MKKISLLVLIIILSFGISIPVYANENQGKDMTIADRIVDMANLLSNSEEDKLLMQIEEIAETYEFDAVIVTSEDWDAYDAVEEADDFFDYNGYGYGEENDGILFYVNLETRDWAISTTGYGLYAFTDYGTDLIGEKCQKHLTDGEYYKAFNTYLKMTNDFLDEAETGKIYDVDHKYVTAKDYMIRILIVLVVSLLVATIAIWFMKSKMKTAISDAYAKAYIKNGSFNLTRERDSFLYSHTVRTAIPKQSSSGGGTSSHTSSSGTSHGGSSGKF